MCRQLKFASFLISASRRSCCGITERILLVELWESKVGSCEFLKPKQIVTLLTLRNRRFKIYCDKYNQFIFSGSGFWYQRDTSSLLNALGYVLKMFSWSWPSSAIEAVDCVFLWLHPISFKICRRLSFLCNYIFVVILGSSFMRENLA
jgi:hypothetical protein